MQAKFDWVLLIDKWPIVVLDFQLEYGIDLEDSLGKPWTWFELRVTYLAAKKTTLIYTLLTKDDSEEAFANG